jgi:hypothetical protein
MIHEYLEAVDPIVLNFDEKDDGVLQADSGPLGGVAESGIGTGFL